MKVTWTAQHGCANPKNNCNMVLEYTCDTHNQDDDNILNNTYTATASAGVTQSAATQENINYDVVTGLRVQLKNGLNTNTPNDPNNIRNIRGTKTNNDNDNEGRHESQEYYIFAKNRERNKGLFTADQKLQGNDQTKTRQNPGGTRRGLEVPEERDYFPWWEPTIWRPLFIVHNDVTECLNQMARKSAAVETKTACVPTKKQVAQNIPTLTQLVHLDNKADCENPNVAGAAGVWLEQKFDMDEPKCIPATWSQANSLGNVMNTEKGGLPNSIPWKMPSVEEMAKTGCYVYKTQITDNGVTRDQEYVRFQTRLRYNMTTMDYAPYATFAGCNQDNKAKQQSPVQQNPTVDVGVHMQGLRLALNTAQTGRTFQDRSAIMRLIRTPNGANSNLAAKLGAAGAANRKKVQNVNVQGKRGNIVQTFPAVEYDFWPKIARVKVGECIAFSWTGSNTHNNGKPAGDGQAGDAGEGRGGSDRSNLIQLMDKNSTFPIPLDKLSDDTPAGQKITTTKDFFAISDVFRTYSGEAMKSSGALKDKDAQAYLLSGGFYNSMQDIGKTNNQNGQGELNVLLNNTPASMKGITACPKETGTFEFTCTRNNNFSNRDQKLTIIVSN